MATRPTDLPDFSGSVDILRADPRRPQMSHVVIDFDGTLSWLRHGWPEIMLALFRQHIPVIAGESEEALTSLLQSVVLGMNGRPTITQMLRFVEIVSGRGGPKLDAEELRATYQARLDQEIERRSLMIASGESSPDEFVVFGARHFLQFLRDAGITAIVLSSTVQERVREEAELLELAAFFGHRINGGTGDPKRFSKKDVLQRILREEQIAGENLLSIGDGPAEIVGAKELGALTIGVCSDEDHNGSGVMDPYKYQQLKAAGADILIPDFQDAIALLRHIVER